MKLLLFTLLLVASCRQRQAKEPAKTVDPAVDVLLLDDNRAVDEFLLEEERVREEWDSLEQKY